MAIGQQNPREPRDLYHLVRPNTAIWIGRILPLMPWFSFAAAFALSRMGVETSIERAAGGHIFSYVVPFVLQFMLMFGIMLPIGFKAGIFQYTGRQHMDEFELRLVEKARLFTYRLMGISLLAIMFLSPVKGPIADFTGGPSVESLKSGIMGLVFILFTVPPAYFHWSLKPVSPDENIRPDPPFIPEEYASMTFWQRFWRR